MDTVEGKIYWASGPGMTIWRCNLDGSNVEDTITVDAMYPTGIALAPESGWFYWTDDDEFGYLERAVLWEHGDIFDLNELTGTESAVNLALAWDINDVGQIVGRGTGPAGFQEAFLLTPVRELNAWALPGSGSYNDSTSWTQSVVPGGVDEEVGFLDSITGDSTVTIDSPVTLSNINFDSPHRYTIAGPGTVTLATSEGVVRINVQQGDHTITAPLSLAGELIVDTNEATRLTLDPSRPGVVVQDVTKTGNGSLAVSGSLVLVGELDVEGGVLDVADGVLAVPGGEVRLGAGATLLASGPVNRHVSGAPDSRITAKGPTYIGLPGSANGYDFAGIFEVGEHLVGLIDADEAELRGASVAGGILSSFNGIELGRFDPDVGADTALTGVGTVNGNVQLSAPGEPPAFVFGDVGTEGIVMTGVVSGNGNLFNVNITGVFRPGFSPTFSPVGGGTTIGATKFEIGGVEGGTVLDAGFGGLVVGEYAQLYAYGNFPGLSDDLPVLGPIQVELTGGYVPQPGTQFDVIVTGQFDLFGTVLNPASLVYGVGGSGNVLFDFNEALLPEGLEWVVGMDADGLSLTVVPEPGALVLSALGGLCLLALRRRKNRR